ncbi:MAG: Mth938-like domain-containing protein [Gemmatimonadota bacterium]
MTDTGRSPRVTSDAWGSIEVEDADRPYRDAKLWPGGSREWDWNETGTRHAPGIQPADVAELLEGGAETVVLSRGRNGRLGVMDRTLDRLEEAGVDVVVERTPAAIETYNALADRGARVGALIHTTC